MVHCKAFSGQQDAQTAIPEPTAFIRQFTQPLAQGVITLFLVLRLKDGPVQVRQLTRPTLRQAMPIHYLRHSPSLHVGRQ